MGWAAANWDYLAGRIYLAGLDPGRITPLALCQMTYALIVTDVNGMVNLQEVRDGIDAILEGKEPIAATEEDKLKSMAAERIKERAERGIEPDFDVVERLEGLRSR